MELYNTHCPIKSYIKKNKFLKCPWMTKGLQNACKKKNYLYRIFTKLKTEESERRYKLYKNKLTAIIRTSKKLYYKRVFETNKNNTKKIWEILNDVTRKGHKKNRYPDHYVVEEEVIENMSSIVDNFNNFFVKVGPDLAAKIPDTGP